MASTMTAATTSSDSKDAAVQELSSALFGELSLGSEGEIDWERTAGLAQRCADSLRTEQARTAWAQGQLIPVCGQLLEIGISTIQEPSTTQCMTQCCRVIGNIVLDHPTNRKKCLASRIPQRILGLLKALQAAQSETAYGDSPALQASKASIGALLNLTIDTPQVREILLQEGAPDIVSKSLSLYRISNWSHYPASQIRATTAEWTTKLLQELILPDDKMTASTAQCLGKSILSLPVPPLADFDNTASIASTLPCGAVRPFLAADLSILSGACDLLEPHAYTDEAVQEALYSHPTGRSSNASLLGLLLDFVEHAELLPSWLEMVKEEQRRATRTTAATTTAGRGESALDSSEDEDEEQESLEIEKTFSTVKAGVARIAIAVCSNDRVMEKAFADAGGTMAGEGREEAKDSFSWVIETAVRWLSSGRSDLVITGSTMLANLARKDTYCVKLLHDYSLASPLSELLTFYSSPPSPSSPAHAVSSLRPGEATQILYGLTGLLKNLSIPGANKQLLCDSGVIEPCFHLLRQEMDMVVPLQTAAVGLIKHLCAGNVSSALKVVLPVPARQIGAGATASSPPSSLVVTVSEQDEATTPLNTIVQLAERTNDVRLKCEATRLLGNVIRSLYSSRSAMSPVTPSALGGLEMGLAKGRARGILERNQGTVDALAEMLRTGEKYPVLVNEAIVALTLLSTTEGGASMALKAIIKQHEVPVVSPTGPSSSTSPEKPLSRQLPNSSTSPTSPPSARRTNGYTSHPVSRASSLGSRVPPPAALDILLRWLTEYAISAEGMPVEMAGNAMSLLEGCYRRTGSASTSASANEDAGKELRLAEVRSVLRGVANREPENPAQRLLRDTAIRAAANLKPVV